MSIALFLFSWYSISKYHCILVGLIGLFFTFLLLHKLNPATFSTLKGEFLWQIIISALVFCETFYDTCFFFLHQCSVQFTLVICIFILFLLLWYNVMVMHTIHYCTTGFHYMRWAHAKHMHPSLAQHLMKRGHSRDNRGYILEIADPRGTCTGLNSGTVWSQVTSSVSQAHFEDMQIYTQETSRETLFSGLDLTVQITSGGL